MHHRAKGGNDEARNLPHRWHMPNITSFFCAYMEVEWSYAKQGKVPLNPTLLWLRR